MRDPIKAKLFALALGDKMKSVPQFVSDYLDGDLSGPDHAKLRQWLFATRRNVDSFVTCSFIHSQLMDWIGPEPTKVREIVAAETLPKRVRVARATRAIANLRSLSGRLLALATVLAAVVAAAYLYFGRVEAVASVSGTRNVLWTKGADVRKVGSLLRNGEEVAIDGGTLHIVFARGGQVSVQGPARFRIESDMSGRLLDGRLFAFTPEHAVGFTIHTTRLTAVDLGTEFYLEHQPDNSCSLEVFDGLVEVQLDRQSGKDSSDEKLQIPEGRAINFNAGTGRVTSYDYDKTKRPPDATWSQ
jgi:hypothetical protein